MVTLKRQTAEANVFVLFKFGNQINLGNISTDLQQINSSTWEIISLLASFYKELGNLESYVYKELIG